MSCSSSRQQGRGRSRGRPRDDGWSGQGGYMNAKRQKLLDQFEQEAPNQLKKEGSGSKIFSGVSIHVNGYTKPSSDELKRMMMLHGGSYEHYLYRTRVTHVIATNLPDSKIKELKGLKVVKPEWITESIAAGKLLNYEQYLLYTAKSGLQQGLHAFTVRTDSDQSIYSNTVPSLAGSGSSLSNTGSWELRSINSNNSLPCKNGSSKPNIRLNALEENENSDEFLDEMDDMDNDAHEKSNAFVSANNKQPPADDNLKQNKPASPDGLIEDTHVSPSKAGDPKFLNEYYNNSRLHYLSTWKSDFKSYVNELQSKGGNFPGRENLRKIVQEREVTADSEFDSVADRNRKPKRCVMHVDMDCFFVSVGLRKRPDLRGKPVAVTHSKGKGASVDPQADLNFEKKEWALKREGGGKKGRRSMKDRPRQKAGNDESLDFPDQSDSDSGDDVNDDVTVTRPSKDTFHSMAEIASCSYEARKAGVKNGMFMGQAKKICPELQTIPYDFEGYNAVSKILYDTVASYTHDIEAVSCDEMLVDCTDLLADTGATPLQFTSLLRDEIFEKAGCSASAGLASNILLAKMATRKAKPNGQFHLTSDQVEDFIKPQSVNNIPGVGWSLTKRFEAMKVLTCSDLQRVTMDTLQREFGPKTGQSLYRYCRGQDDRPIKIEQQRKSVSAEVNYGIRFTSDSEAVKFVQELSEEVCTRLKNINMKGKTVTLKLMVRREDAPRQTSKFMGHGICNHFSKSVMLPLPTDDARIVGKECVGILKQQRAAAEDLRGIGIQVQKLEPAVLGTSSHPAKNQSILNFTVTKPNIAVVEHLANNGSDVSFCDNSDKVHQGKTSEISKGTSETHSLFNISNKTNVNQSNGRLQNVNQSESLLQRDSVGDHTEAVLHVHNSNLNESHGSRLVLEMEETDDLVGQLARRQAHTVLLPPLPCLPDIRTPDSNKKPLFTASVTPQSTMKPPENEDYFPSPSQIDPAVLDELPPDIREQIEKEIRERQRRSKPKPSAATVTRKLSAPGCSHWQPEQGDNSNVPDVQIEADDHSQDAIVPLPSPSQLDLNCLNALPECMQKEIREAYSRKDYNSKEASTGSNMLKLQQAKSPTKSPHKRSPSKNSPNFKVPRGRPRGGGRKRGSSKKLLFKDQTKIIDKKTNAQEYTEIQDLTDDHVDYITDLNSEHYNTSNTENQSTNNGQSMTTSECDTNPNQSGNSGKPGRQIVGVNLCGAVELRAVRSLIKEWICSTPEPQSEDEEVLVQYLQELVLDKNLEQVDLVLKFMYRNIKTANSLDWLPSLKRIFSQIQSIIQALYGSKLCSINV